jgi:hypothetical protein
VWSFFFLLDRGTIWRGNVSYNNLSSASDITNLYSNYGIYIYAGPSVMDGHICKAKHMVRQFKLDYV